MAARTPDMQQQQLQQDRSWREQIGSLFRQPELDGSVTSRGGGGIQVGSKVKFIFTMDSFFDRNIVFGQI